MGGGGGGGAFINRTPDEMQRAVRQAENKTTAAAFETQLASMLTGLLGSFNARDTLAVQERLDDLKLCLRNSLEGSFDQVFGGSVAKHTYVDGLSDIDSLLLINDSSLQNQTPKSVLKSLEREIGIGLGKSVQVSSGRMAVTIVYADNMIIQLLPAIKSNNGEISVPSSRSEGWSKINPIAFQEALTRRNAECSGKLIPTIKLAKAIVGQLPENQRLSGYHMESIGIAAFKDYAARKTTSAMLPYFFERARDLVLAPIRDSTGQSVHVDDYLGPADSTVRQAISHVLSRLVKRMRNATAAGSSAQWKAIFGFEE